MFAALGGASADVFSRLQLDGTRETVFNSGLLADDILCIGATAYHQFIDVL